MPEAYPRPAGAGPKGTEGEKRDTEGVALEGKKGAGAQGPAPFPLEPAGGIEPSTC